MSVYLFLPKSQNFCGSSFDSSHQILLLSMIEILNLSAVADESQSKINLNRHLPTNLFSIVTQVHLGTLETLNLTTDFGSVYFTKFKGALDNILTFSFWLIFIYHVNIDANSHIQKKN